MISGLVLKYRNGLCFFIRRSYGQAQEPAMGFLLTPPSGEKEMDTCPPVRFEVRNDKGFPARDRDLEGRSRTYQSRA
jgi:hypothetical protein